MNNSFTKKTSIVLAVHYLYSILWKEREKMALQSDHCFWNQWNLLHNRGFF